MLFIEIWTKLSHDDFQENFYERVDWVHFSLVDHAESKTSISKTQRFRQFATHADLYVCIFGDLNIRLMSFL